MGIFKYTVFSFSVTHGILYFFYDLVLRNAAALPTMARYRQLCVKILTRLYSTRYPWIPVARNYVSAHTLTDEKVLIPSPDSRRHTIYFHENLLSSRETRAFCGTRVAWCIPPARKLICPGDYAPYFIMRRYVYIFPPGREPSPCYQNKDDRTTPPPPSLFSFPFFSLPPFLIHAPFPSLWLLHRIITRMQIRPLLDRYEFTLFFLSEFIYPRERIRFSLRKFLTFFRIVI